MAAPRVFVSYIHESEEHRQRVLELAQSLRGHGIDARLDRFVRGTPAEGWPLWMESQLAQADYVLVVCSAAYLGRYAGECEGGLGGRWEAALTRQSIYAGGGVDPKFVPVLFPGATPGHIPTPLAQGTYYTLLERYDELVSYLRGEAGVDPVPLGQPAVEGEHEGSRGFSTSVRSHMSSLRSTVQKLTEQQFEVIRRLSGFRRVRVTGCAGSGKTLVAAEKAIRLSQAGLKTLFLCHNPLLAKHVRQLTEGSGVRVSDFCSWVGALADGTAALDAWNKYEEPDETALARAFDRLTQTGSDLEAVIVDEGQDFRSEWWTVVEAALSSPEMGILYIFHDDNQALLPHRAEYPVQQPVYDLSRNCRNAGRVYRLMRYYLDDSPSPDAELAGLGRVSLGVYESGGELEAIGSVLHALGDELDLSQTVVLLGGALNLTTARLAGQPVSVRASARWQDGVRRELDRFWHHDPRGVTFGHSGREGVAKELEGLSQSPFPTPEDTALVQRALKDFRVDLPTRRRLAETPRFRNALGWKLQDGKLRLWRGDPAPRWSAETLIHFERDDWTRGLPEPRRVFLTVREEAVAEDSVRVFEIGDFKGLEAESVILLLKGISATGREIYVGLSRARHTLSVLVDGDMRKVLPPSWLGAHDNPFRVRESP